MCMPWSRWRKIEPPGTPIDAHIPQTINLRVSDTFRIQPRQSLRMRNRISSAVDGLSKTVGCVALGVALCLQTGCTTHRPTAAQLQPLQGTWEESKAGEKVTVTITGNSLHFHRDSNFWFETRFTLPAGTDPRQLHATIKSSSPPEDSKGKVVVALFKIEDGMLTLAAEPQNGAKAFEEPSMFHHKLRKVQSEDKSVEVSPSK